MNEETIENVSSFIKRIEEFGNNLIYRGHSNEEKKEWKLVPLIGRLFDEDNDLGMHGGWNHLQDKLLEEFKSKSIPYLRLKPESEIELMVLGQHYGLPTRLLDWTENPLIAILFALIEDSGVESTVWAAMVPETWGNDIPTDEERVIKLLPNSIDSRIMNQNSCFTIHPFPEGITPLTPIEDLFKCEDKDTGISRLVKFTIPADSELKKKMLIQLKKLGIDYNFIYPDLTGLCMQIKMDILNKM